MKSLFCRWRILQYAMVKAVLTVRKALKKTAVQYAEQYGRQTMFQLMFTLEKFWE